MLAPILALSILHGAAAPGALDRLPDAPDAADPSIVVVDCQIAGKALAGCTVVGEVTADRTAAALKLASTLVIPDPVLQAGVSHVRLRLKLTPSEQASPSQSGTNEH